MVAPEFLTGKCRRMIARTSREAYFGDLDVFLCPAMFMPSVAVTETLSASSATCLYGRGL